MFHATIPTGEPTLLAQTLLRTRFGEFRAELFEDGVGQSVALIREPLLAPVRVRIQSSCLFGETFLSQECDCRTQTDRALEQIAREGGVFLYLFQEGRGAGLATKIHGMNLEQSEGISSEAAYKRMGLDVDLRDYTRAMRVLASLLPGKVPIIVLSQNRRKIEAFRAAGFPVAEARSI